MGPGGIKQTQPKHIGNFLQPKRYSRKPRYSVVLHDVRDKLDLSLNEYVVIDSIHKLSTSNRRYPYCTISKDDLAKFLKLGRATVFRAIEAGINKGLVERTPESLLRTTEKWSHNVEMFDIRA